jgi:hypothetical protein
VLLAALWSLTACSVQQPLGRYFAPHARFPARPDYETHLTEDGPMALLEAGHANIGEIAIIGSQDEDLETFVETLLREAKWNGGELVRVEEVLEYEEPGFVEGREECTFEVEREHRSQSTTSSVNWDHGYASFSSVTTTHRYTTTECQQYADAVGLVRKRMVRATFWRAEPGLAATQLRYAREGGDEPVALTRSHSLEPEYRACRAGRAQSCERAARLTPYADERFVFMQAAYLQYDHGCGEGVPAACRAAQRLVRELEALADELDGGGA